MLFAGSQSSSQGQHPLLHGVTYAPQRFHPGVAYHAVYWIVFKILSCRYHALYNAEQAAGASPTGTWYARVASTSRQLKHLLTATAHRTDRHMSHLVATEMEAAAHTVLLRQHTRPQSPPSQLTAHRQGKFVWSPFVEHQVPRNLPLKKTDGGVWMRVKTSLMTRCGCTCFCISVFEYILLESISNA